MSGFGSSPFGGSAWGGALSASLTLVAATASRENQLRLQFSTPVYYSGLFDVLDASNPERYSVAVVAGSVGMDGEPVRPVAVVTTEIAIVPNSEQGTYVFLNLDRPMSPYPAAYVVAASNLVSADLSQTLDTSAASIQFYGVHKALVVPTLEMAAGRRDIANPQSASQAQGTMTLGTLAVDASGDYAFDEGLASYKKRILRRLISARGGFKHLPEYGVGIPGYGKKLATANVRATILAEAKAQIQQEPETAAVSVTLTQDPVNPALTRIVILARTRTGQTLKFGVPFGA